MPWAAPGLVKPGLTAWLSGGWCLLLSLVCLLLLFGLANWCLALAGGAAAAAAVQLPAQRWALMAVSSWSWCPGTTVLTA